MIHYNIPWDSGKNLSGAYNRFMNMIPENDWACFVDGDARFTIYNYGEVLDSIVEKHGKVYPLMTAMTNRVGTDYQCVRGSWGQQYDWQHRHTGKMLAQIHGLDVDDITDNTPLSGVLILCKRELWEKASGLTPGKMLGADNLFHYAALKAGAKVGLMRGIYMEHWYRGGDRKNKSHLV